MSFWTGGCQLLKAYIVEEVKNVDFVASQANVHHPLPIFTSSFLFRGADTSAAALLDRLSNTLSEGQATTLITQACEGAAMMERRFHRWIAETGKGCLQKCAHVHSCAQQLTLVMQQATAKNPRIHQTWMNFLCFFRGQLSKPVFLNKQWLTDFQELYQHYGISSGRLLNTVHKHKHNFQWCFRTIRGCGNCDYKTERGWRLWECAGRWRPFSPWYCLTRSCHMWTCCLTPRRRGTLALSSEDFRGKQWICAERRNGRNWEKVNISNLLQR